MSGAHIHLGPGKLGLGLVAAASVKAGLELHVIGRVASKSASEPPFELCSRGLAGREHYESLPIANFARADCWDQLCLSTQTAIIQAPDLLLTTSVTTAGLSACQGFVLDLVARRQASSHVANTTFIAAENDPGPSYPSLAQQLTDMGVDCRRTVVNRFCTDAHADDSRRSYVVTVDELAEWVIEGTPTPKGTLGALADVSFVSFVSHIDPLEVRKRWLVSGMHMALAIVAQSRPLPSIDVAMSEPGRTEWVIGLQGTLIETFEHLYPGIPGNQDYAVTQVPICLRHVDPVTRILSRLKRTNLVPFFEDFDRKFADAVCRHPNAGTGPTPQVREVFDALQRVLERRELYVDFAELAQRLPRLPLAHDVQALLRYDALLNGILDPDEIRLRVSALDLAFSRHRDYYRP